MSAEKSQHTADTSELTPGVDGERNPIDVLSEEFLERCRNGDRPNLTEFVQRRPDLAHEIRELFPVLLELEQVRADSETSEDDSRGSESFALQTFDDYRIVREIGRGGMGVVYEAEQMSLARHVALKVLSANLLRTPKHQSRFRREAKAAARLHHTNIVPVFDVGECEGHSYYVMQYIHGFGLDELLEELIRLQRLPGSASSGSIRAEIAQAQPNVSAAGVAASLLSGQFRSLAMDDHGVQSVAGRSRADTAPRGSRERHSDPVRSPVSELSAARSPASPVVSTNSTADGRFSETLSRSGDFRSSLAGSAAQDDAFGAQQTYWERIAGIGVQVARALEYAHGQGILHRDIKPGNLLLDIYGTAWITDFGLAKLDDQHTLTRSGDLLGTLRYMAPETFQGQTDRRSEIYSLGLTLYELLALKPAFDETRRNALVNQVLGAQITPLETLNPEIPADLRMIVHKAIEREPAHRYQTAAEFAEDLQRFLNDEPVRARRISLFERFRRWSRHNRGLAAALTALAAVVLLINTAGPLFALHLQRLNAALTEVNQQLHVAREKSEQRAEENARLALEKQTEAASTRRANREVQNLNAELRRQRDQLQTQLYQTEMLLAGFSREESGGISQILTQTRGWIPHAGDADLRGWEWYFLNGLCHRDVLTLSDRAVPKQGGVVFSHDGSRIAAADRNGETRIWEAATGTLRTTLKGHSSQVLGVCWSPNDRWVATTGYDRKVLVFDAQTGDIEKSLKGLTGWGHDIDWHPNGHRLAVGQASGDSFGDELHPVDGIVRIWDLNTEELVRSLDASGPVISVKWSPDGRRLAFRHRGLSVLDVDRDETRLLIPGIIAPAVAWSPGGDAIAFTSQKGDVSVVDLKSGKPVRIGGHELRSTDVAWSPDGTSLATASDDQSVKLWNPRTHEEILNIHGHTSEVYALAWSPDGRRLVTGGLDGVKLWEPARPAAHSPLLLSRSHTGVVWSPDGRRLAVRRGGSMVILDPDDWRPEVSVQLAGESPPTWSPDQALLAVPVHNEIVVLDAETGETQQKIPTDQAAISTLAWSPDGELFASGDWQDCVCLIDARTGDVRHRFQTTKHVSEVGWSSNGRYVAAVSLANLQIWEARTGDLVLRDRAPEGWYRCLSWRPDGEQIAVGTHDRNVRIYDLTSKEMTRSLSGHSAQIAALSWAPDGLRLASAAADRTIRIWDPNTGRQTLVLKDHRQLIADLTWSPDGGRLVSAGADGLFVFDALPGYRKHLSPETFRARFSDAPAATE